MKGKDMINIIKEHNLEDMDLEFVINNTNKYGICIYTYDIEDMCDIGYSSNVVSFYGELKE